MKMEEQLATLVDIGKTLTSSLEIDQVNGVVMEKVSLLLKPQAWSLLLKDEETGELCFEIAVSPAAERLKGVRLPAGEGIAGWVAEHGAALLVPDVASDERFAGQVDRQVGFDTRSIVCVPLKNRGRTLGVIQLINSLENGHFGEADLRILSTIADFAAIAIDNARLMEKVNQLVITDDLTGLFNARHFQELLDYEVERSRRYSAECSLVFIDLDHFKQVNDTYGHLTGSRVLKELGGLIRDNIRRVNRAARYGGDEFVILLPSTGKRGAFAMASNLRQRIKGYAFRTDSGETLHLTASFGIATFPDDAADKQELVRLADQAMYQVKYSTRDAIQTA